MKSNSTRSASERQCGNTQGDENIVEIVGRMTPQVRERIIEEAARHVGCSGRYPVKRLVAKNLRLQERVVEEVLVIGLFAYRSELATLRSGVLSSLRMAQEAGREVWLETRRAA